MFVGETGVLRIVERTCELMKQQQERGRARRGRHRSADDAEVPEPLVLAVARPLRRGDLLERGDVLRLEREGPREGGVVRRPPGARRRVRDRRSARAASARRRGRRGARLAARGGAAAQRDERGAARRVRGRLAARRRQEEPRDRGVGRLVQAEPAEPALPPELGDLRGAPLRRRRQPPHEGGVGAPARRVAADRERRGLREEPDGEAGVRSEADGELDRGADEGASRASPSTSSTCGAARAPRVRGGGARVRGGCPPPAGAFFGGSPCSSASFFTSASRSTCSWYCGIAGSCTATCTPARPSTTSIAPCVTLPPLSGLRYSKSR